jgi:WD40 repeat protein
MHMKGELYRTGHSAGVLGFFSAGLMLAAMLLACSLLPPDQLRGGEKEERVDTLKAFEGSMHAIAFSQDGKTLATGVGCWPKCGGLTFWDAQTGRRLSTVGKHRIGGYLAVAYSPDGAAVAAAGGDGEVQVFDAASGKVLADLVGHTAEVKYVSYSADGKTLATSSLDKSVRIWDAQTGKLRRTLWFSPKIVRHYLHQAALSPDGALVAVATSDKQVRIFKTGTGDEEKCLPGHDGPVAGVLFTPDGKTALTSGGPDDPTIRVWDLEKRAERFVLKGHTDSVPRLALSADGKRLASGSLDKTARVWNLETGKEVAVLKGHESEIYAVAISPDGKTVVTSSGDYHIKVWDAETGQEKAWPAEKEEPRP